MNKKLLTLLRRGISCCLWYFRNFNFSFIPFSQCVLVLLQLKHFKVVKFSSTQFFGVMTLTSAVFIIAFFRLVTVEHLAVLALLQSWVIFIP